jgi:hypothetical protein
MKMNKRVKLPVTMFEKRHFWKKIVFFRKQPFWFLGRKWFCARIVRLRFESIRLKNKIDRQTKRKRERKT